MSIDPKTFLVKQSPQTTKEQAKKYVRTIEPSSPADLFEPYIDEVYKLYSEAGYSPEAVIGQWAVETGAGTSDIWRNRLNPAGIGVTDGGDKGYSWGRPEEAAQGHLVHLSGYVDGYNGNLRKYLKHDPRYLLLLGTDYAQSVKTVNDLAGKWATDPEYGNKIAWRIEGMRGTILSPSPPPPPVVVGKLVFGRVPRPRIVDRIIPDANTIAWDDLGQRSIYGVVYHRQLGENWGTDAYFRNITTGGRRGLTDYGIDRNTGEILKWNDPYGKASKGVSPNRSPWASGGPGGNSGDGIAFVQKYTRTAINRNLTALEIDGWYESDVSNAGYLAIVSLTAHLADANKVPWTDYPTNPRTGLPFTYWHNEFQQEKDCPGSVIMNLTPQIIADTKAMLKKYQVG